MTDRNKLIELAGRLKAMSPDGRSFIINDSDKAAKDILAAAQFIRAIAEAGE